MGRGQPRRAANVDNNQADIVKALRNIPGVTVEVGHDDIIVGWRRRSYWFEIKNPERALDAKGKLRAAEVTDSERKRLEHFTGHYEIVWSLGQILSALGIHGMYS